MHNYCLCDIKLLVHHVFYHNRVIFCQFFRLYQDVVSHLNQFPIQITQFNKILKLTYFLPFFLEFDFSLSFEFSPEIHIEHLLPYSQIYVLPP